MCHRARNPSPNKSSYSSTSETSSQTKLVLQGVQGSPTQPEASEDGTHVCICALAENLCHLVKKLWEEVSRLCSMGKNEKEIDRILTEILQRQEAKPPGAQKEEQPETVLIQVANGDSCNGERWEHVTSGSKRTAPSLPKLATAE